MFVQFLLAAPAPAPTRLGRAQSSSSQSFSNGELELWSSVVTTRSSGPSKFQPVTRETFCERPQKQIQSTVELDYLASKSSTSVRRNHNQTKKWFNAGHALR